jgi:hypothetical protein
MKRLVVAALLLAGCPPRAEVKPTPVVGTAAPTAQATWKTLRAEHRVALTVELDGGKSAQRTLRGLIAVERPDKLRLRALGPGGITLFDVVVVAGKVTVKEAIRDPNSEKMRPLLAALAGDLQAAFLLEPAPEGRAVTVENEAVVVREPERTVRLEAWQKAGAHAVPARIVIENRVRRYNVVVDSRDVELDSPLDPALFSE